MIFLADTSFIRPHKKFEFKEEEKKQKKKKTEMSNTVQTFCNTSIMYKHIYRTIFHTQRVLDISHTVNTVGDGVLKVCFKKEFYVFE